MYMYLVESRNIVGEDAHSVVQVFLSFKYMQKFSEVLWAGGGIFTQINPVKRNGGESHKKLTPGPLMLIWVNSISLSYLYNGSYRRDESIDVVDVVYI